MESIASVYFYGNIGNNKPNDIYKKNRYSNLTINGNGVCAMYGGVRNSNITKNDKGLYILGNIWDMNNRPITINNGILCLLATIKDLNSYKGKIIINEGKLVIWLADTREKPSDVYEYGLEYFRTPSEAQGAINNFENPDAGSLLEWMKNPNNANSYYLQRVP